MRSILRNQRGMYVLAATAFIGSMVTTLALLGVNEYYKLNSQGQRYRRLIAANIAMQNFGVVVSAAHRQFRGAGACGGEWVQLPAGQPFCFRQNVGSAQFSCIQHPFQEGAANRQLCITPAAVTQDIQTASFELREIDSESRLQKWLTAARQIWPHALGLAVGKYVGFAYAVSSNDPSMPNLVGAPVNNITIPAVCDAATPNSELCVRCNPPGGIPNAQPCIRVRVCLFSDPASGQFCPIGDDSMWLFQRFAIFEN